MIYISVYVNSKKEGGNMMVKNTYKTNRGILIEEIDNSPQNPMDEDYMERFTTFYTFSRNYSSPEKCPFSNFKEWMYSILSKKMADEVDEAFSNHKIDKGIDLLIKNIYKRGYVALPVFKFEHGDICYKASIQNPWINDFDSCFIGIIYCTKADIYKEYGRQCCKSVVEKVHNLMKSEVELYSFYVNGEVYIYTLEDTGESICGYYGDIQENGILDCLDISDYSLIKQED